MFNPFYPLTTELLYSMVQAGKTYFVRQDFPRGKIILEPDVRGVYLFTHYSDAGSAQTHFAILKNDPSGFLYDWSIDEHKARLEKAAAGVDGYKCYSSTLWWDIEKRVSTNLRRSIMAYLKFKLKWFPTRNDSPETQFYPQMGELYIEIKFRNKEVRIPVSEIEKFNG
ncbi:MAG: hypothetical protein IPN68_16730 [Bacteroidetes bacterium]|nr:hypothetical protein [Bacteroidota bacterium]